ncbi:MAG TPA: HAD-IA family hydrolase [Bryobacteraceae bacterium]|nr:HAD-IA family hydrolase [Bryobacteraceae bacterium]
MQREGIIVFDMDGVLVDVTHSYRAAIMATVEHFTGRAVSNDVIQDYKNTGGWNNDWALSQKIIQDFGRDIDYPTVVAYFQSVFIGNGNGAGLISQERWIVSNDLLLDLRERFALAIFTGRLRSEAFVTLHRFLPDFEFDMVVADDDVRNPKPAPDGLHLIAKKLPKLPILYIGDTVDDAQAARDAGVRFIGIAHRANPRHEDLACRLRELGATHVFDNVNELPSVL